jgi:RHS repeat-associated protein
MNRKIWGLAATLCSAPLLSAQQQYFHSENLYPFSASYWSIAVAPSYLGCPSWAPQCYVSSFYSSGNYGGMGGSLASFTGSTSTSGGEVRMVVGFDPTNPVGQFVAYIGTPSSDVNGDPSQILDGYQGNFIKVSASLGEIAVGLARTDPTSLQYFQYSLSTTTAAVHSGSVVRAIFKPAPAGSWRQQGDIWGWVIVYVDNVLVVNYPLTLTYTDPVSGTVSPAGSAAGYLGFGVEGTESLYCTDWDQNTGQCDGSEVMGGQGNLLQHVDLGYLPTVFPNAIPASSITTSATTNQVNIQWPAGTDNTGGSGVWGYQLYRNGALLTTTQSLSYVDTASIVPSTTYTYMLSVLDYDMDATNTTFTVQTPGIPTECSTGPAGQTHPPCPTLDGHRVGVRPTGAYWGGANENIDTLSGNLNYTLPLFKAQARGGVSVAFNLVYNLQNWRQDSGGEWVFDGDVGYGFGWQLLAGSIMPVWNAGDITAAYYLYTDPTGAQYHLNQNSGSIWSSQESIYVYFDASVNVLHFKDGTHWTFGCISAATEADSGVMHPTLIEDTNGNQITISYQTAPGANWANSSARITTISDVRSTSAYTFTYNSDTPPHLTAIRNNVQTGEAYNFTYSSQAIASPFNSESFGTAVVLSTAVVNSLNLTNTFTYDGSAELTKIVLPYGGYLAYNYTTTGYSHGISYREVLQRHLASDGTSATDIIYPLSHESSPGNIHHYTILEDPSGVGEKCWAFGQSGASLGLMTTYQGRSRPGTTTATNCPQGSQASYVNQESDVTWAQDGVGNSYIATTLTTLDPGQSFQAQKETTQTVDNYGNVLQMQQYDYNNLSTPLRTYTYTWLHTNSSTYQSLYILNRMTGASVAGGGDNITLATVSYDLYNYGGPAPCDLTPPLASATPSWGWDSSVTSTVTARGNPTEVVTPSGPSCIAYDVTGNVVSTLQNGVLTQATSSSNNNLAVPSQLAVGSLTANLTWSTFLGLTNETGPNGNSSSTLYDQYARPSGSTSPFGATTAINYSNPPYTSAAPPTITSTINNGRWTTTTMDGIGRTILITAGDATGAKSQAESIYGPCGCSPMGKLIQQAMPHAPGASPIYTTTYTYDGIGRTLTVLLPDGVSKTTYLYQGNTVKVTDPAGSWKTFTMDVNGNLTQVAEPNPSGGQYVTTYVYNLMNSLVTVTMVRPTGTQTRSFTYNHTPYVYSATNPENGTVSYTYNQYNKVATKTDAKGQQVVYTYDTYARLTEVQRYPTGTSNAEAVCQRETYYYDTNPFDSSYSQNASGRLTAVQYYGGSTMYGTTNGGPCDTTFTEMYSYQPSGTKAAKRLRVYRGSLPWINYPNQNQQSTGSAQADLDSTYMYDTEGRMTVVQYPGYGPSSAPTAGPNLGWAMDTMGRLNTMTDLAAQTSIVSATTYGPSNELLSITGNGGLQLENRTYNAMLQLVSLSAYSPNGGVNMTYAYSSSQNNGKVISQTDNLSGEQVVYAYDALNRLASATATSGSWGQSYAYDGFGNLTDQNVTAGSAPAYHVAPDPTTNHLGSVDLNGNTYAVTNASYDVENRFTGTAVIGGNFPGNYQYSYAPGNKRVWRGDFGTNDGVTALTTDEVTFWSVNGQKLATYNIVLPGGNGASNPPSIVFQLNVANYYFGGKLVGHYSSSFGLSITSSDRLGSIGKFYPYGQEKPSATQNGTEKFTGYFRDSETGFDYAVNRYHNPGTGRFLTPDPYRKSARARNPGSWNRYAYALGDPVNRTDRKGLCSDPIGCSIDGMDGSFFDDPELTDFYDDLGDLDDLDLSGVDEEVQVQPTLQYGPTQAQAQAISNGYNNALEDVATNVPCDTFLASAMPESDSGTVFDVYSTLLNTVYAAEPLANAGSGAQTNSATNVFINSNGAFFNATPNANGTVTVNLPGGNPITFANMATFQGFILLHELGHQTGALGPDAGPGVPAGTNLANSLSILNNCFQMNAQGVYSN